MNPSKGFGMANLDWKKASKSPLKLALLLAIGTPILSFQKEKNLGKTVEMYKNKQWSVTTEPSEDREGSERWKVASLAMIKGHQ